MYTKRLQSVQAYFRLGVWVVLAVGMLGLVGCKKDDDYPPKRLILRDLTVRTIDKQGQPMPGIKVHADEVYYKLRGKGKFLYGPQDNTTDSTGCCILKVPFYLRKDKLIVWVDVTQKYSVAEGQEELVAVVK